MPTRELQKLGAKVSITIPSGLAAQDNRLVLQNVSARLDRSVQVAALMASGRVLRNRLEESSLPPVARSEGLLNCRRGEFARVDVNRGWLWVARSTIRSAVATTTEGTTI